MNIFLVGGLNLNQFSSNEFVKEFTLNYKLNKLLFVSLASNNQSKAVDSFCKTFTNVGDFYIDYITDKNINQLENKLLNSEIIFFGGGNTQKLINAFHNHLDILKEIIKAKVIIGVSAGINFLFQYYYSDKDSFEDTKKYFNFKLKKGLNMIPLAITPHFNKNGIEYFFDDCIALEVDALALEDDFCIHINKEFAKAIKIVSKAEGFYINSKLKKMEYLRGNYEKNSLFRTKWNI